MLVASVPEFISRTCSQLGTRVGDRLGELHLARRRRAERRAVGGRRGERRGDRRVGVAEDDGAVALDEVDVARALDVPRRTGPRRGRRRTGAPPTALNARIDELTPPGIAAVERVEQLVVGRHAGAGAHRRGRSRRPTQRRGRRAGRGRRRHACPATLGEPAGEVGEDDVGAGPLDRREVLEGDGVVVDPAVGGGGLDHRVLAADVVRRERDVDALRGPRAITSR